jgi:hypothetical protein|tara:strand:- start:2611 stop:3288 length:678 start_codon:yes stop_codon:yes gene_type:complete
MFLYANSDGSPISQTAINDASDIQITPVESVDLDYNICYTVFDYETDKVLPPCIHFLDNFLTSEVYVFSVPLSSELLQRIENKTALLESYCNSYIGYPKTAVTGDFELGWVGIEKNEDITMISNIQLNGIYWDFISKKEHVKLYKTMVEFCKNKIDVDEVYIPTAETLRKLNDRFSTHPDRCIMETPYTSTVLKNFKKTTLPIKNKIFANKYLSNEELQFYKANT